MTKVSTIADADWLTAPQTQALIAALDDRVRGGPAIRFVGGCVRNTLMDLPVEDIDVATAHTPEKVIELARAAGFHPVPTGIAHGTVTVVVQGMPFEVTTLRIDVQSHGRHADIAYTQDWAADAARRDFTINAIYADASGALYDPVGGVADIAARRVRFIGDAHQRIREDFLRILRFFRFHAWYGEGALDAVGLEACTSEREGLKKLSAERVQKELLRLLEAPSPLTSLSAMAQAGILSLILPEVSDFRLLMSLIEVEGALGESDALRRLAALIKAGSASSVLASRLKLSNDMRVRLKRLRAAIEGEALAPDLDARALRHALYIDGADAMRDRIVVSWAMAGPRLGVDKWKALLAAMQSYSRPKMPIDGNDLQALGLYGAKLGEVMKALEAWWIDEDFVPSRDALLARAKSIANPLSP